MRNSCLRSLALVHLLVCASSILLAQNSQLTGLMKDKSQAVVPSASVTLTNVDTGAILNAKSSKVGFYVFASIVPGRYSLAGDAPGFAKTVINDVKIDAAANVSQDIVLQVQSASQAVNVESDPPAELTETTAAISAVFDQSLIENMPLNGNSLQTLFELAPGVVTNASGGQAGGGGISVNGQRPTSNYVSVDGTSANISALWANPSAMGSGIATSASGGTNGLLPVDAVEEFRMQTSSYSAEYGRTPGGQRVSVESEPYILEQFVGGRVVHVKGLSRLHVVNAESNKRIVVGRGPQIMESSAQLHLLALISEGIIGIEDNEMIAEVHRA